MTIKFYCKKCGQRLSVADKKAGKSVSCPACKNQISIPSKSEPRRVETKEKTPDKKSKTPPETKKTPDVIVANQDEDQLLNDLDDLGPLGESWDEILEEDLASAAASEVDAEPSAVDAVVEEPSENSNDDNQAQEVTNATETEETTPSPSAATSQHADEQEKQDPESVTNELTAGTQTEEATSQAPTPVPWEDDDDDEEDDEDEGFSIRSPESEFEEMDLTPMVDVTFLLLIFFMITASFSLQKSIQVPPPNPDEDGVSQSLQTLDDFREESIIVEIDNNNGIYVDDTKLSNNSEIAQAILDRRDQDGKPKTELVLSAHNAARHETVVAVVDAANEVGMQKIRLASYQGPED